MISVFSCKGDYAVVSKVVEAIPTELGQLSNWKYVVFGKLVVFYYTC